MSLRRVFVELHAIAGSMDDEHSLVPCGGNRAVDVWSHLGDSLCGAAATVRVPHVHDDDGGLGRNPCRVLLDHAKLVCAVHFDSAPSFDAEARKRRRLSRHNAIDGRRQADAQDSDRQLEFHRIPLSRSSLAFGREFRFSRLIVGRAKETG